jgi:signal transduction histidine kinase
VRLLAGFLDRGASLAALLVLLMLVPAGFVLWFMNEAVTTQAEAARRSVTEAHRGQLRLVRSRVDAHWRAHAASLSTEADPSQRFAQAIASGAADGLILLDAGGRVIYPDRAAAPAARQRIEALLAEAERLPRGSARDDRVERIAAGLNDYTSPLPASERLALMERLRKAAPNVLLPTEAPLRLSLALAAQGIPAPGAGHFQPTSIRNVWAFGSNDGRAIALYWTGRIESMMHDLLHQVTPSGIRFIAYPPDVEGDPEAIAAGAALPGWQLTFQPLDRASFDAAGRTAAAVYVSVAAAAIAAIVIVGAAAGRTFRRHLRLARLKTDLVAAVSHELRTPLASMRVLVDGLLDDEAIDPVKTRDYLRMLIDNFLAFARLERGRHQFVFAPTHPAAIVATATEAIRERLPAGCDFRVEVPHDLPPLVADADALATALVNLLDNAVKYTPADKRIVLRVHRAARDSVVFAVQDNGFGIPAREQRRIFRRFYRIDRRLTSESGGVGLGLSIVELIVRAHGGDVGVTSDGGAGSTFTVRVPAAPEGAAA